MSSRPEFTRILRWSTIATLSAILLGSVPTAQAADFKGPRLCGGELVGVCVSNSDGQDCFETLYTTAVVAGCSTNGKRVVAYVGTEHGGHVATCTETVDGAKCGGKFLK